MPPSQKRSLGISSGNSDPHSVQGCVSTSLFGLSDEECDSSEVLYDKLKLASPRCSVVARQWLFPYCLPHCRNSPAAML
jgi:hypothetical protein